MGEDLEALNFENARFLNVHNGTTLIASMAAIVGTILLAALLWIAVAAAFKEYYGGGSYGGGYKKKRSVYENDSKHQSLLEILMALDEELRKHQASEVECAESFICEVYLQKLNSKVVSLMENMLKKGNSEDNNLEMTGEAAEKILRYTEAAERGRRGKNCKQLYQGCKKVLKVS
ncbi:uncharacterized protein LOC136036868 [Artemia franciscana]|uniref:Uncharacterized protein n=1 Tax=Artemia franciscana TaxID=6661 RepID=A0AA88I178_ARTSF|nr:hypothetical protein QYM36_005096 [Artemia franciscana]